MSDDEADPELLELLRQSLGLSRRPRDEISPDTGVLKDAQFIYNNAIDVSIDMHGTKAAAESIYNSMQQRSYSTHMWGQHDFHPTPEQGFSEVDIVNFVFTMDLLNFSFWSERSETERFQVEYKGKRCTGYKSLVACLRRALDNGVPITTPRFWSHPKCTDVLLQNVFRSATNEEMPLLSRRIEILREAGRVMTESFGDVDRDRNEKEVHDNQDVPDVPSSKEDEHALSVADLPTSDPQLESSTGVSVDTAHADQSTEFVAAEADVPAPHSGETVHPVSTIEISEEQPAINLMDEINPHGSPDTSVVRLIEKSAHSAGKLVNLLVKHIPSFCDEARFEGRRVRLYKRAQIFVADLWAALNGTGYGELHDIDHLTMFADYRVPQVLRSLGVLVCSPALDYAIRDQKEIAPGHSWEVQLRGCSIWAVELLRREIMSKHPDVTGLNAVLIDFFLYDLAKEKESAGESDSFP